MQMSELIRPRYHVLSSSVEVKMIVARYLGPWRQRGGPSGKEESLARSRCHQRHCCLTPASQNTSPIDRPAVAVHLHQLHVFALHDRQEGFLMRLLSPRRHDSAAM